MVNSKYYSNNINLIVQKLHIDKLFPNYVSSVKRDSLKWVGVLQPTPISSKYKISLTYKLLSSPEVRVIYPKLDLLSDKKLPHVYTGNRLCLYFPGEWNKSMLIADTIIPWTSEWLFYYEIWKVTGEWHGGGKHPKNRKKK